MVIVVQFSTLIGSFSWFQSPPHLQFGGQRLCSLGGGETAAWMTVLFAFLLWTKKRFSTKKNNDWWYKKNIFSPRLTHMLTKIMIDGWCYYPNQHIVHREWRVLICHEDKVEVITPINILFRGGDKFWPLMKVKLMFLPQATYCSEGVANFNLMMVMMWWWWWWWWWWRIVSVEQRPGWGERV